MPLHPPTCLFALPVLDDALINNQRSWQGMAESEQAAVQLEQLTLSDAKQEEAPAESTSAEVAVER